MSHQPPTIVEMTTWIQQSYARIQALVQPLSEEQLSVPGPEGWAVKDHLAHLADWELGVAELLEKRDRMGSMGLADNALWEKSVDEINALLQDHNAALTAGEAKARLEQATQQMLAAVGQLEYQDLSKPYSSFAVQEQVDFQDPVWNWIEGNSWGHFEEHEAWIKAFIEQIT
jgi:hypothetical protein